MGLLDKLRERFQCKYIPSVKCVAFECDNHNCQKFKEAQIEQMFLNNDALITSSTETGKEKTK